MRARGISSSWLLALFVFSGHASAHEPSSEIASLPGIAGRWSEFMLAEPSARFKHAVVYDSARNRLILFGGWDGAPHNDVWALSLDGPPAWTRITPAGAAPEPRFLCSAIYDALGDRVVIFGGVDDAGGIYLDDTWALTLGDSPAWQELAVGAPRPAQRAEHTAIYDAPRRRMIMFGGFNGIRLNDTSTFDLETDTWAPFFALGTFPPGKTGHSAVHDAERDRMIVFGGTAPGQSETSDTWELTLGASPRWTQLFPAGSLPDPRRDHSAVMDMPFDRMIVFGGISAGDDAWVLALGAELRWTRLNPDGIQPTGRDAHEAVYASHGSRMLVHGGRYADYLDEVWALDLGSDPTWAELDPYPQSPSPRRGAAAVYDDIRDQMIVYGGLGVEISSETWILSLSGALEWTKLTPAAPLPQARWKHAAIFDPLRNRLIIFGGSWDGAARNDVWALQLGTNPTWSRVFPSGSAPYPRYFPSAVYDPVGDRMLIFGGFAGGGGPYFNDVWALNLAGSPSWEELQPSDARPRARAQHAAIYDATRGRMIIFGGTNGTRRNDVWSLDLDSTASWVPLVAEGSPPTARVGHTAVHDVGRNRMVVFGGYDGDERSDVWGLTLAALPKWNELSPAGAPPTSRLDHAAVYDSDSQRMVAFGGILDVDGYPYSRGVWLLSWNPFPTIDASAGADMIDASGDRASAAAFHLAAPSPNPSGAGIALRFSIPEADRVSLEVIDTAGRRRTILTLGHLSAGEHQAEWHGTDADGKRLPAGVYFITLRTRWGALTRKTTLL
jgi:FlgD Ig-like domain/Galactose oxidase, central domain